MAKDYLLKNVPFVEARFKGDKQRPSLIIVKTSGTTSQKGAALGLANRWHKPGAPRNPSHYVLDEAFLYRCVPDNVVAGDSHYGTRGAIHITVCTEFVGANHLWGDPHQLAVLDGAADLVAKLVYFYKIPAVLLTEPDIERWRRHSWRTKGGILIDVKGSWPHQAFHDNVLQRVATLIKKK